MLTIPATTIKALLRCASKKDVRYYLQGVYFTVNAAGRPLAVATDGKLLLAIELEAPELPFPAAIVPREALEAAVKMAGKAGEVTIGGTEILAGAGRVPYSPIDGRYPDFSRVLPSAESEDLGVPPLDAIYLAVIAECAQLLQGKKQAPVEMDGRGSSSGVLVRFINANAIAVVMPTRVEMPGYNPALFGGPPAVEEAA